MNPHCLGACGALCGVVPGGHVLWESVAVTSEPWAVPVWMGQDTEVLSLTPCYRGFDLVNTEPTSLGNLLCVHLTPQKERGP